MLIIQRAHPSRLLVVALLLIPCLMLGCMGGSKADLSGKVSVKGKNLTMGSVVLQDENGKSSSAAIGPDGSFHFTGVPTGKMTVYLDVPEKSGAKGGGPNLPPGVSGKVKFGPPAGSEGAEKMANMNPKEMNKGNTDPDVPVKYKKAETSTLTVDLKSGKNSDLNIDLTD